MNEKHLTWFKQFCEFELQTGGPDPHMRAVVELCKDQTVEEQVWRALLYVGVYNVPSAEAIWRKWPIGEYQRYPHLIEHWLDENWAGIKTRRERRTTNSPIKLARYLENYNTVMRSLDDLAVASFEDVWRFSMSLSSVGRYAATKIVEIFHRLGLTKAQHIDIRAKGGWSPRLALNLIFSDDVQDARDDSRDQIELAEQRAIQVQFDLAKRNLVLSIFELEVLLCEYKACYSSHRQYPGRSLDSELNYEKKIAAHWNLFTETEHMKVRKLISPSWALGEIQGWDPKERLDNLGSVLANYGYIWSDSLYSYKDTTDFADPVKKVIMCSQGKPWNG